MTRAWIAAICLATTLGAQSPQPPQASQPAIEGVRNYTKVDATVGCAGSTDPKALSNIASLGYKSVLNLREATEEGARIDESKSAAAAAGLKYIHLPFRGSAPDPKVVEEFLKVVSDTGNQPVFIHCGSANRVGGLWLVKRMLLDKWPEDRALAEAKAIGLSSATLQKFLLDYVATHKRNN